MIAPRSIVRSNTCPPRIDSDKSPAQNKSALAGNLAGVSTTHSQPYPVSSEGGGVSGGILRFDPNSANGQPLGEVNKASHMGVLFNKLGKNNPKIGDFETFTKVMTQGCERDLKNSALAHGIKSALALFDALPADKQDNSLLEKAGKLHKAMEKLTQQPDNTANKDSAYKAMKTLIADLSEKMGLSEKNAQAGHLDKFCADYLNKSVYPDIISKLAGKLSPDRLEELKKNPEKVVEHLYAGQNQTSNTMIETLKTEFFEHQKTGDKAVKMFSLIEALEQKTQLIAGLVPDIAEPGVQASPLTVNDGIGQADPANSNNVPPPGNVINHISNITTTNITNNYYATPSSTPNYVSATTNNLSTTEATTAPEDATLHSAAANQTDANKVDSALQLSDEVDNPAEKAPVFTSQRTREIKPNKQDENPVSDIEDSSYITTLDIQVNSDEISPEADDIYHAVPAKVLTERQLNTQGTLFAGIGGGKTSGPTPSWRDKPDAKVTLTNDGRVRDLSRTQDLATQKKQPASVNAQGNQFVGFGKSTSAPTQSFSATNDAQVTLTRQGAQTRDLSKQLAYKLGDTQQKSSSAVNAQGNQFTGVGGASSAPTQSWLTNNDAQVTLTERGAQTRDLSQKASYRDSDTNAVNTGRSQSNKQATESV